MCVPPPSRPCTVGRRHSHYHRLQRLTAHLRQSGQEAPTALRSANTAGSPKGRLAGKVAVISGAGAGIGRETALTFAREGATVFGCGRTLRTLEETRDLVRQLGGVCNVRAADVSQEEQCKAVIDATVQAYGRIDILVNNAGVGYEYGAANPGAMDPLHTTPSALWQDVLDINLNSVYFFSKYAIPAMVDCGARGAIVNVSSAAGIKGGTDAHACTVPPPFIVLHTEPNGCVWTTDTQASKHTRGGCGEGGGHACTAACVRWRVSLAAN